MKTTLKDDFSSKSCSPNRDIISNDYNKITQIESIESINQPEIIGRFGKALFRELPQSLKETPPRKGLTKSIIILSAF